MSERARKLQLARRHRRPGQVIILCKTYSNRFGGLVSYTVHFEKAGVLKLGQQIRRPAYWLEVIEIE